MADFGLLNTVLGFFAGIVLLFAIGSLIGFLLKLDKYLK
jgi:hypothetical protein